VVDHLAVVDKGRAALRSGDVRCESAPVEGQARWGIAVVLRPDSVMRESLAELGRHVAALAGEGHWTHGRDLLHVSLRSLAPYREHVSATVISEHAAALDDAVGDMAPISASVRTVNPHSGGVGVHVHPHGRALDDLYVRLGRALGSRGLGGYEYWTRDLWYVNLVHFAGPVTVGALLAWTDAHRDLEIGTTTLTAAELVRFRYTGSGMRAETLHLTRFTFKPG